MEFSAPGVQARDRSWKRYYFVLHGTCLRIYKHDTHKFPIKDHHLIVPEVAEEDLSNLHVHKPGEKREPVTGPTSVRPANAPATGSRRESVVEGAGAPPARRGSISSDQDAIGPAGRRPSASSMGSSTVPSSTASTEKEMSLFMPTAQPAARRPSVSVPPPAPSSGINARDNLTAHLPFGGGNALIKQYTLQNAESGLAADYVKKRNVVRLRVEGEQFLLQTDSARDVVDWIEVSKLQARSPCNIDANDSSPPRHSKPLRMYLLNWMFVPCQKSSPCLDEGEGEGRKMLLLRLNLESARRTIRLRVSHMHRNR
jgi:hypothetical protein